MWPNNNTIVCWIYRTRHLVGNPTIWQQKIYPTNIIFEFKRVAGQSYEAHAMKTVAQITFKVNKVVWAKIKDFPAWPTYRQNGDRRLV